jgi:hypothetical protein
MYFRPEPVLPGRSNFTTRASWPVSFTRWAGLLVVKEAPIYQNQGNGNLASSSLRCVWSRLGSALSSTLAATAWEAEMSSCGDEPRAQPAPASERIGTAVALALTHRAALKHLRPSRTTVPHCKVAPRALIRETFLVWACAKPSLTSHSRARNCARLVREAPGRRARARLEHVLDGADCSILDYLSLCPAVISLPIQARIAPSSTWAAERGRRRRRLFRIALPIRHILEELRCAVKPSCEMVTSHWRSLGLLTRGHRVKACESSTLTA